MLDPCSGQTQGISDLTATHARFRGLDDQLITTLPGFDHSLSGAL
jgi:hypothetical protein